MPNRRRRIGGSSDFWQWCDRQETTTTTSSHPPGQTTTMVVAATAKEPDWKVARLAFISRILITVLAIVADWLFPDHQPDGAFIDSELAAIPAVARPFTRWDAQYFLSVAYHAGGYRSEPMLAFLPGYPLAIRTVSLVFVPVTSTIITRILLAAYMVNLVCFVCATVLLYRLTWHLFRQADMALGVVRIFIFNPASIFFTAFYSESLFAALTLAALHRLYIDRKPFQAAVWFAMATLTRSNGLVAIGYLIFYETVQTLTELRVDHRRRSSFWIIITKKLVRTTAMVILVLIPFAAYQWYAYRQFCHTDTAVTRPEWCYRPIPLSYNAVQSKYWNVGFLHYYQWRQTPNFLLAAPTLAVIFYGAWIYASADQANLWHRLRYTLINDYRPDHQLLATTTAAATKPIKFHHCLAAFPFAIHSCFLATVCLTTMNIQVATRFLFAANPWPCWSAAWLLSSCHTTTASLAIKLWLAIYFISGTVMFANFLPFT